VTVRTDGMAVDELLSGLSERTGVSFSASREAGDDKVIAFGPARPLAAVLRDVAALFGNVWESKTGPDGRPTYRLVRSVRVKAQERRLQNLRAEAVSAQMAERVREAAGPLPPPPAEPASAEEKQQYAVRAMERGLVAFYAPLSEAQRGELLMQGRLSVPIHAFSEAQWRPVARHLAESERVGRAIDEQIRRQDPQMVPTEYGPGDGVLRFIAQNGGEYTTVSARVGEVTYGLGRFNNPLTVALPPHGNPYERDALRGDSSGVPVAGALPSPVAIGKAASGDAWPDRLRRLAEAIGRPILSDYYRGLRPDAQKKVDAGAPGTDQMPEAVHALDAFCRDHGYLWWATQGDGAGGALLFRKRDWYDRRLSEIPDRWYRDVVAGLKTSGGKVTRRQLLKFGELSAAQIDGMADFPDRRQGFMAPKAEGLPELLDLMGAVPGWTDDTPLPRGPVPFGERNELKYAQIAGRRHLRESLDSFLLALHESAQPSDVVRFAVSAFVPDPKGRPAADSDLSGARGVPVVIEYRKGNTYSGYSVLLPLSLPDDRSPRDVVELAPAATSLPE